MVCFSTTLIYVLPVTVEQSLAIGESRTEDLDVPQPDCDIPQNSPDFSVLKPISHPSDQNPLDVQNQVSRTESIDLSHPAMHICSLN